MATQSIRLIGRTPLESVTIEFSADLTFDASALEDYSSAYGRRFIGWNVTPVEVVEEIRCDYCGGVKETVTQYC